MRIRSKILLAIIPLMLASVILSNTAFWLYMQDFVHQQEQVQVKTAVESVSNYTLEKTSAYLGRVNDWAHWDDTYQYMQTQDPNYITLNMNQSTFDNLDLSFFILIDDNGQIVYSQFYDLNTRAFSAFPSDFSPGMADVLQHIPRDSDHASVEKIGSDYYFFASSNVTSSLDETVSNGMLLIGRILNATIAQTIESISSTKLRAISTDEPVNAVAQENQASFSYQATQTTVRTIQVTLMVAGSAPNERAIRYDLEISRDLYVTSMQKLMTFVIINTLAFVAVTALIVLIWSRILSKPFERLVSDVGRVDSDQENFATVSEEGSVEFVSLGRSINHLLSRIQAGQKELADSKKKLQATLTSVGDGVLAVDIEQNIVFMNPVAQQLTGWQLSEVAHAPVERVFRIINEYTRDTVPSPIEQVFERAEIVELANHTLLIAKDGSEIPIEDTAAPILDEHGAVTGCVLVFRDSSERKEKQRRIEYLSYHDQLTGLFNRRYFEEEFHRLDVERNLPISIIYADVNGLKIINDAFGHESGDQLLTSAAESMKASCRADDIIVRIGGDEFVLLLPKTDAAQARKIIERIQENVELIQIHGLRASVSFGFDTKTDYDQDSVDIMKNAERNMYQEKIQKAGAIRSSVIQDVFASLLTAHPPEKGHSIRVGQLCEQIGRAYHLDAGNLSELKLAGELHDIGKISVDAALLSKVSALSDTERMQLQKHPEKGYRLLSSCSEYYAVSDIILAHHERWDGSGYPKGLKGEEINWKARVLAVVEAYDTMVNAQPYRGAMSKEAAISELRRNAGSQFDPDIVEVLIKIL